MKRALIAGLLACAALGPAQLTNTEKRGIESTLFVGNMTSRDLEYERRPFNDKYRLPLVNLAIDKPLEAADKIMAFHQSGSPKSLAALIRSARTNGLSDPGSVLIVNTPHPEGRELRRLPAALREPVKRIADAVADSNAIVKKAISNLTPEEVRYLIEALPLYANEEPSIKFAFSNRTEYDAARILQLVDKVDLVAIRAAAEQLATNVESVRKDLEAAAKTAPAKLDLKLKVDNLRIDVAGVEDNVHEASDAVITIDLGGNDIYRGRVGAGISYSSVLIDLGGNDIFEVPDLSLGAGILGVGLVYDIGGHDIFRCRSICLGAGLCGVGAFYHEGGKDTYEAVSLAEGFGEFGIGILADTHGDDRYDGNLNVQGAARTGGVGWLVDQSGNDLYRAGGLILNSPLFEKIHYSNGQGYASGYREDTGGTSGGIGLLTDLGGHDNYIGETYCQAASYWFSLGSLYDAGGNDSYVAYHYAQSSAMHMTAAYLFDLSGDDSYTCKLGACHACGHDYGVAFFLDRAGMDLYAAHDSRPAVGNANGLALFVDDEGDDRYFGPPAVGLGGRGSGSLAVFCDLAGTDQYADGLGDGQATARDTWGVAYDAEGAAKSVSSAPIPAPSLPQPGSQPKPQDAELEQIYRKATQWGVGTAQQEVAENVAKLIAIGKPALEWMIATHLPTADRLQIRAFTAVVRALAAEGHALIAPKVGSDNVNEARVALSIASELGIREAAPFIPAALKKPELQRSAARAAGPLGSREALPDLMALTLSDDRLTALAATVSLVALGEPTTLSTAEALLGSNELPIRMAALELIVKFPNEALAIGKRLAGSGEERTARSGVEILGRVGSAEALDAVGKFLVSGTPGVKVQALIALNGRVPQEYRTAVVDARKSSDPIVRAVAARTDLGR